MFQMQQSVKHRSQRHRVYRIYWVHNSDFHAFTPFRKILRIRVIFLLTVTITVTAILNQEEKVKNAKFHSDLWHMVILSFSKCEDFSQEFLISKNCSSCFLHSLNTKITVTLREWITWKGNVCTVFSKLRPVFECYVMFLCYVMLCYVMLRYVTLRYITLRYVTLRCVRLGVGSAESTQPIKITVN